MPPVHFVLVAAAPSSQHARIAIVSLNRVRESQHFRLQTSVLQTDFRYLVLGVACFAAVLRAVAHHGELRKNHRQLSHNLPLQMH